MAQKRLIGTERGSVLVEGSLVLPFLALTFLFLFDSLTISKNYISMTLIAREAVRTASTLEGIGAKLTVPASAPTEDELRQCYDNTMTNYQPPAGLKTECAKRVIAQRVTSLIRAYNLPLSANSTKVELSTDFTTRIVAAKINSKITGLSFLLKGSAITTSAAGSYDA